MWCARAQRDRRECHDDFVEQAVFEKLTNQFAATYEADVVVTRCGAPRVMHGSHVPAQKLMVCTTDARKIPRREHPRLLRVRPWLPLIAALLDRMFEHPLVRGRTHCHHADSADELCIVACGSITELKEPIE